jgi:hypothetical protein
MSAKVVDDHTFTSLDLVVTAPIFEAIVTLLQLDPHQAEVAQSLFQAYHQQVVALDQITGANVQRGLTRMQELNDAARMNARALDWAEAKKARSDFEEQHVIGLKKSDTLLNNFYGELFALLREDQQEAHARLPALVRRMHFEAKTDEANKRSVSLADFSSRWNLSQLIAEARAEGGEFERGDEEFVVALLEIMERYDAEMDIHRQRDLADARVLTPPDDPVAFSVSHPKGQEMVRKWRERFFLLQRHVDEVAAAAEGRLGAANAEAWRNRLRKLWCPALYAAMWPDRMIEWLTKRPDATPEQREHAATILASYELYREQLRLDAIKTGIAMMSTRGDGETGERTRLHHARMLLRLRDLNERTTKAFRSLLIGEQVAAFDSALQAARTNDFNQTLMGPYVSPDLVEKITGEHVPRGILLGPINPETGQRAYEIDLDKQGVPHYELEEDN